MRPVLNLFLLVGTSVGFHAGPARRGMGTLAASSLMGSSMIRSTSAIPHQGQTSGMATGTCSMSAADFVDKTIDSENAVIFSKSYCPFCAKTKSLFNELAVEHTVYELDQRDDGEDIQEALLKKTGQRTVPNVFVKGTHVGGNDAVQAANKNGALKDLLKD